VSAWSDNTTSHGFVLRGNVFTPVSFPLAKGTIAFGINDNGDIAGSYKDTAGNIHGFLFSGGALSTVDVAGARDTELTSINNEGWSLVPFSTL
jgi:uncharacterized membrane protein